ncbi:MAG: hypothetical protein WA945_08770 [Arcobacteraceae bacterium]
MTMYEQIEEEKKHLVLLSIEDFKRKGRGLSAALILMIDDIFKMEYSNIPICQQKALLESVLDVTIKYDTYKKWHSRHIGSTKKIRHETVSNTSKNTSIQKNNDYLKTDVDKKITNRNKYSSGKEKVKSSFIYHNPLANEAELI